MLTPEEPYISIEILHDMALTETIQIELGYDAPWFSLPEPRTGNEVSFSDVKGEKGTVVMFICNHCPYVVHVHKELVRVANDYLNRGIGFVAISSNDIQKYPEDAPEKMAEIAKQWGLTFPYLYDASQEVAKSYKAACTPDFSVFDASNKCVYRGRLDGSTPGNDEPVTGKDLRVVLESLVHGKPAPNKQIPSMGCNIKWK